MNPSPLSQSYLHRAAGPEAVRSRQALGVALAFALALAAGCRSRAGESGQKADGGEAPGVGNAIGGAGGSGGMGGAGPTATGGAMAGAGGSHADGASGTAGTGGTAGAGLAASGTDAGSLAGSASVSFAPILPVDDATSDGFLESIDLIDVNGDGKLDLLTEDALGGRPNPIVRLGNGDGTFGVARTIDAVTTPEQIVTGDLNGDRHPDLVFTDSASTPPGLSLLLNQGDGTFAPAVSSGAFSPRMELPRGARFGDLNSDGLADIVVVSSSLLYVSLSTGHGTFSPPAVTNPSAGMPLPASRNPLARALALGDLNGDGKVDVVVGIDRPHFLNILLNQGDGTLAPPIFVPIDQMPDALVIADMNGDGKADIVLGSESGEEPSAAELRVLINEGAASFASLIHYDVASALDIKVLDFNGDGKLDVITDGEDVRLGIGDGSLAPAISLPVGPGRPVAFGDLDGDGKTDVAIGVNRNVHVFLNTSPSR
jgi:hypothetical protein